MKPVAGRLAVATGVVLVATVLSLFGCAAQSVPAAARTAVGAPRAEPDAATEQLASCMREDGWEVEARPDNSVAATYPSEQFDAYNATLTKCMDELGLDEPQEPPTQDELRAHYAKLVELHECLEAQGYDAGGVPSEQAYLDGAEFDPYWQVYRPQNSQVDQERYYELLAICPRPQL